TKYVHQKEKLTSQLTLFLMSVYSTLNLDNASPGVMREFLVWKDSTGKTKVHLDSCVFRTQSDKASCKCPIRRAASSLDTLIGQLRAIFRDHGRGSDWNEVLGFGNPMAAPSIKRHLQAVTLEQSK
ncbi:hypothetical protein LOTGIDRAFT_67844, partial [Lottia gigantea]